MNLLFIPKTYLNLVEDKGKVKETETEREGLIEKSPKYKSHLNDYEQFNKKKKKKLVWIIVGVIIVAGIRTIICFAWPQGKIEKKNEEPTNKKEDKFIFCGDPLIKNEYCNLGEKEVVFLSFMLILEKSVYF